ncbi:12422_t:CDS:2, partial [Acaulospora colombiana]
GFGAGDGLYQQPLFAAANLSPGIHVVTLTNNRNSRPGTNTPRFWQIIWEEELGGQNDTLNNQTDDDNASGFEYGPAATAWNTVPENVVQYHGGTGHTTVSSTAYVTYTFTGDAVSIFGALGPTQGPYSVQLDGNAPANYSAVAPSFFAQQLLYHATGLGGGQHSVRLTNMPAKTGDSLSVDYAIANAVQVPIIITSSTSSASTSSSATTTSTSETAAATSDTPPPSSKGLPTGGIVAIVVGSLALMAIISFALM